MVYNCVLRQWPADMFNGFKTGDNLFPTTICVLVSAIQKIARVAVQLALLSPCNTDFC